MIEVVSQAELVQLLKRLKRRARFKIAPQGATSRSIGQVQEDGIKNAWTNYHIPILFRGERIHAKIPKLGGHIVQSVRHVGEMLCNDSAWVYASPTALLEAEEATYTRLTEARFLTFRPRQDLITADEERLVTGILLTETVKDPHHVTDLLETADNHQKINHVRIFADGLKRIHSHDVTWGDARLGNGLYTEGTLFLYDFGMRANSDIPLDALEAKDLEFLCYNAPRRCELPSEEVVPAIVDAFQPENNVREYLAASMERKLAAEPGPMRRAAEWFFYHKPILELSRKKVQETQRAILNAL
jgi:tRNA A-37 threonylcarbamoyl transferase component Bud32